MNRTPTQSESVKAIAFPVASKENRLIAEFMGKTYHSKLENGVINELYYHSSWDWLMPVLEKISKIPIEWQNSNDRAETHYPRTFGMLNEQTKRPMVRINGNTLHEADTLMEATYSAVVDFILQQNAETFTEKFDRVKNQNK